MVVLVLGIGLLTGCFGEPVTKVTPPTDPEISLKLSATMAELIWGHGYQQPHTNEIAEPVAGYTPVVQSTPAPLPQDGTVITPTMTVTPMVTEDPLIQLLFTGTIVTGRCVQDAVDKHGNADFLYDDVRGLIRGADFAVGLLNSTISDTPPSTGCVPTFVLTGRAVHAEALANAGFDLINMATNHIKNCGPTNCGDRAFLDTLENLHKAGIRTVGAGLDLQDALEPVVVEIKGVRFAFVALGEIEKNAFATEDSPGIAVLTDENLTQVIKKARREADVVIVMPHWGSDYSHLPNYRQLHFAKVAAEAGADLVVGNHAHVIQGYQNLDGVPVFYGLGSFVFDQDWSLETQQGLLLSVVFQGSRYKGFELTPVHIHGDGQVTIALDEEAESIIRQFNEISGKLRK